MLIVIFLVLFLTIQYFLFYLMKVEVNRMDVEELRRALCRAIELDPGMMLEVMKPAEQQPGGYHPTPGSSVPDWCVCTKCREMPTQVERKCCGKSRCVSLQAVSCFLCNLSKYVLKIYLVHFTYFQK